MLNRIGYNVDAEHAGSDRQYVVDAQVHLHSTVTLIMDDHKSDWYFSRQIAVRAPETLRFCRTYMNGWDGNTNEAPDGNSTTGFLSPLNYVNFLENLHAPDGTIHQVQCEPDMHRTSEDPQGNRLRANVHWQSEVAKEMSRRGMRGCFDNKQTVTIDEHELDAGLHDELYHTLSMHPEHFLGVHAYFLGDAWFNTSDEWMKGLTQSSPIDTRNFITMDDATLQARYIAHPSEAHLGREELIATACRKIGAKIPRMVYTEIGVDHVRLSQLGAVEAINGRKPMGFPTMTHYWHVRYPQWSAAQTMVEFCKWLNRSMPAYIVGACLFGFDTAFENGAYHLASAELQSRLQHYADSLEDSEPIPSPPPVVTPTTHDYSALRPFVDDALAKLAAATAACERLKRMIDDD